MDKWTCKHCGAAIGTYEPAVLVDETGPRQTSKLAESEDPAGALYHSECWDTAAGES